MKNRNIKGIALILAIGVLAILAIIATSFSLNMRLEYNAATNYSDGVKARYLAEAAVQRAIAELKAHAKSSAYDHLGEAWAKDGYTDSFSGTATSTIVDEQRKVNINNANQTLLENLFIELGIGNPTNLTNAIIANRPFYNVRELATKTQITKAEFEALTPHITATSYAYDYDPDPVGTNYRSPININTCSNVVLRAVLENISGSTYTISAQEAGAVAADIISARATSPITNWSRFNSVIDGSVSDGDIGPNDALLIKNNCNPNRDKMKPATHTANFCFNSGGWYEIKGTGTVKGNRKSVIAIVKIYDIFYLTSKLDFKGEDLNYNGSLDTALNEATIGFDFNEDGDTTDVINEDTNGNGLLDTPTYEKVTWLDSCPVIDMALGPTWTTCPGALKIGYWDDFDEDNFSYNGPGGRMSSDGSGGGWTFKHITAGMGEYELYFGELRSDPVYTATAYDVPDDPAFPGWHYVGVNQFGNYYLTDTNWGNFSLDSNVWEGDAYDLESIYRTTGVWLYFRADNTEPWIEDAGHWTTPVILNSGGGHHYFVDMGPALPQPSNDPYGGPYGAPDARVFAFYEYQWVWVPGAPPVADFTADISYGDVPLTVQFTDASTGDITKWSWNFGDGGYGATEKNPSHTYNNVGIYTVSLTVTDPGLVSDTETKTNFITVKPEADFIAASPTLGNAPLTVQFVDLSKGSPTSWDWDFGDGYGTSSLQHPNYRYDFAGTYDVKLTVAKDGISSDTKTINGYITVNELQANFTSDKTSGNAPFTVQFTDLSIGGPINWSWNFGDGGYGSIEQSPSHTYTTAGTYDVTLTVTGPEPACMEDDETKYNYITVNELQAIFSADVTEELIPLTVNFTNSSTGDITSWLWNFGDGEYGSSEWSPSHTYDTASTYTVSLTVTGPEGEEDTETKTDYIEASELKAAFSANPTEGEIPLYVEFTDQSTGYPEEWLWLFGDGGVSTDKDSDHTYYGQGPYGVILRVRRGAIEDTEFIPNYINSYFAAPVAGFSASPTSGSVNLGVQFTDQSSGNITSRSWDFGDGGTSSSQSPYHTYTQAGKHDVSLTVTGPGGENTHTETDYIIVKPKADFSGSPTSGNAPLNVSFTDESLGEPTSWWWTFGDGGTSPWQNPSHQYNNAGAYGVSLTAIRDGVSSDPLTYFGYITVSEAPPVAGFSASPTSGSANLGVQFTDQSSGNITSRSWDFGDGGTSSSQSPYHTYTQAGKHDISLTVTGPGGSDTETKSDYITVNPVADFSGSPTTITVGESVQFTDESLGEPTSWWWTFGDGGTSPWQNPSHTYNNAGAYGVSLTAIRDGTNNTKIIPGYITVESGSGYDGGGGAYGYWEKQHVMVQDDLGNLTPKIFYDSWWHARYNRYEVENTDPELVDYVIFDPGVMMWPTSALDRGGREWNCHFIDHSTQAIEYYGGGYIWVYAVMVQGPVAWGFNTSLPVNILNSSGAIGFHGHFVDFSIGQIRVIPDNGTYESIAYTPTGTEVVWGTITATQLPSTEVNISTATETATWYDVPEDQDDAIIKAGPAETDNAKSSTIRFKADFTSDLNDTSVLEDVTITYLPKTEIRSYTFLSK